MRFSAFVVAATLAGVAVLGTPQSSVAQDAEVMANLPPEFPTRTFAFRSALSSARISPDGERFAYGVRRNGNTYLEIYDADTQSVQLRINLGNSQDFNWFRWAGNDKLVFSLTGIHRNRFLYSRLFYFDLERDLMHPLVSDDMTFRGDNIVHLDPAGEFVLVSYGRSWRDWPDVWRFDLTTDTPPEAVRVQRRQDRTGGWVADNTGDVRIAIGAVGRTSVRIRYRPDGEAEWETVARARIDDEDSGLDLWDFMGLRAGSDLGYSIGIPEGGDRSVLMEFNFATGEAGDIIHSSPEEDVASVFFDDNNRPIAIGYQGEDFRREWLDPEIREMRDRLAARVDSGEVRILDTAADYSRMLIVETGSSEPGALYVYTPAEDRLQRFGRFNPGLPSHQLAVPQAIRYDARDGTSIHGYLTLPRGRGTENLPLIVYPHGGPYGIRDTDNYNDVVQLLANRGYAVIQPNFRGSGGYGEAFIELGWGQIGRMMQDDLDDAVAHLVAEGIVDPERVCIIGESYGGYAAVWGAIRNPEIYRCAASWAGVMHFERQLRHDRNFLIGDNRGRWVDRVDGDQTDFDLDDVSPAVQVERLTRPVLLAHGEYDNTVPFDQYELMVRRAERADVTLQTFVLPRTGHGIRRWSDRIAWYDELTAFLAEHNPAD